MVTMSSRLGMLRRDGDPATIGHPYVPILLAKRGERTALEHLDERIWDAITPYIRIVPPELCGHGPEEPPTAELDHLAQIAGEHVSYLDAVGSPRRRRRLAPLGPEYMRQVYEAAIASSLAFLPVYPFRRPDLAQIVASFQSEALGAAVLVSQESAILFGTSRLDVDLREEVRSLGIEPRRLDVIVDLGYIQPGADDAASAIWLVRKAAEAAPWRSFVLAATSVPDSVAREIPDDSLNAIERRERALFDAVQASVDPHLRFGDYAVQHPTPPARGPAPNMRANIPYTAGDFIFFSRGGQSIAQIGRDHVPEEYQKLAIRLCLHPPVATLDCRCWGDQVIQELADGQRHAHGQQMMRAIATCHHVTVVAEERTQTPPRKLPLPARRTVQETTRVATRA